MTRPTFILITGLFLAGCLAEETGAVRAVPVKPAKPPVIAQAQTAAASKSPSSPSSPAAPGNPAASGVDYLYHAKFEPPRGRVLHGMGALDPGNSGYLGLLADPVIQPATRQFYLSVGYSPRSWDRRLQGFRRKLQEEAGIGRIPQIDIGLYGIDPDNGDRVSVDHNVAGSDQYDQHVRELAQVIAAHPDPVFLRIGGEFSGDWMDYHPYDYPIAFRKVVDIFRAEGADNVAFVWCYQPAAPDDFDQRDSRGYRWFPGDDVVDWFAIDLFHRKELLNETRLRGVDSPADRTEHFLKMAREHRKPVMIAECSPARVEITSDPEDGHHDWDDWFVPFLRLFDEHPEIEAFYFVNQDWRVMGNSAANGWENATIEINPFVGSKWVGEMRKPRYLHLPDVSLLNGWAAVRTTRPTYKGPGPADPSENPRAPGRMDR